MEACRVATVPASTIETNSPWRIGKDKVPTGLSFLFCLQIPSFVVIPDETQEAETKLEFSDKQRIKTFKHKYVPGNIWQILYHLSGPGKPIWSILTLKIWA